MELKETQFGTLDDGREISRYDLTNKNGVKASIITYGGILMSLEMPDRNKNVGEVTLGFDTLEGYLSDHPYFGATVGRVANRIAEGRFTLNGKEYTLAQNNGENHLHGGIKGFDKVVWKAESGKNTDSASVVLSYLSPDGEEGYPGNLDVTVVYTLTEENELRIDYTAATDAPTPVNLTNHTYWNLAGGGSVVDHFLTLFADHYVPVGNYLIPTGELQQVGNGPFDFKLGKRIDQDIDDVGGFDHCWVLNKKEGELGNAAELYLPDNGRFLKISTTQPGIQFYSGNFLDGIEGRGGAIYEKHHGLCLESEYLPDAINQENFDSAVLNPGETYRETTVHRFDVK